MKKLLVTTVAVGSLLAAFAPAAGAATVANSEPTTTHGACQYTETPDEPAARPVPLPPDPSHTPDRGKVAVPVITNQGLLPLTLDRAEAPCTVQSFLHLARHGFFNQTTCHRLTSYSTLKVLQCGDPTATGEGGPGYSFRDELPTDLPPSTTNPAARIYSRGLVAMANAGPDTNGSQFFLVYGDSTLRPDYTVFGTVGPLGLNTLDRVAAGGIVPDPDGNLTDGAPARKTDLELVLPLGL
ncbi:peptidylprolyl isomerase [Amycolatopsis rhabdoformis]|uniref:Peptidyl-prolyl cis-trans isomerase n=1 Tax=Amycolatopsis rhabdoformis TaxID=1448059 RepID=A0ABZ1I7D4_9PSEU|nr:peptidylprolyl isomerase [Amycolatopsis rhabdoformis]WSE30084.1 peptidylprolyl isomerase [Amycolatopsis rhabdoformis]